VEENDAWRRFDRWFFQECNPGTRRQLYAAFELPLDEISNYGIERHCLRYIRKSLAALSRVADDRAAVEAEVIERAYKEGWMVNAILTRRTRSRCELRPRMLRSGLASKCVSRSHSRTFHPFSDKDTR
jgi:hypothetical protein